MGRTWVFSSFIINQCMEIFWFLAFTLYFGRNIMLKFSGEKEPKMVFLSFTKINAWNFTDSLYEVTQA